MASVPFDRGSDRGAGPDFAALRRARIVYWMGTLCLPLSTGVALGYWAGRSGWQWQPSLGLLSCAAALLGVGLMSVGLAREQRLNGPSVGKQRVLLCAVLALVCAVATSVLGIALGQSN